MRSQQTFLIRNHLFSLYLGCPIINYDNLSLCFIHVCLVIHVSLSFIHVCLLFQVCVCFFIYSVHLCLLILCSSSLFIHLCFLFIHSFMFVCLFVFTYEQHFYLPNTTSPLQHQKELKFFDSFQNDVVLKRNKNHHFPVLFYVCLFYVYLFYVCLFIHVCLFILQQIQ